MTRSLGCHSVRVRVVPCLISPFSHKSALEDFEEQLRLSSKLVLNSLKSALEARGARIGHAETRTNGRGTPLAIRLTV
jgi:hypothetical protein